MRKVNVLYSMVFMITLFGVSVNHLNACTRVVYQGDNNMIITGRTMDWKEDTRSNIWIFPRGMERNGEVGKDPMRWKSKYGSVITSAYDICSTDGMNEKGLVANLLWLAESSYPQWNGERPALSIAAWVQYMLDNFATVDEAVAEVEKNTFDVVSDMMPDGTRMATLHLSISDATGDNAIFEYVDGKLDIHHSKAYQVMTNSPVFDQQLALDDYWKNIGGTTFLPGTNRAADRFVRASQPNISSTRWRTVSDQKDKVYYFESTLYPNVFWIDFKDVDFSEKAPVKKLNLLSGKTYAGNTAKEFVATKPFQFLGIK